MAAAALHFALFDPLPYPRTQAVISSAAFGNPQPTQSDLSANTAGLQSKNAAQVVDSINAISLNDVRTVSSEG